MLTTFFLYLHNLKILLIYLPQDHKLLNSINTLENLVFTKKKKKYTAKKIFQKLNIENI